MFILNIIIEFRLLVLSKYHNTNNYSTLNESIDATLIVSRCVVILLMGEPKHWESPMQIIVDLLMTNGNPDNQPKATPEKHIPVIACNMDLRFMERCHMPR